MSTILEHEQQKYQGCWDLPEYLKCSPGAVHSDHFGAVVEPLAGQRVVDFGCGAGDGGKALAEKFDVEVTYVDIVDCGMRPFIQQPLWEPFQDNWNIGYCCDVMEHLPKEFTMLAVDNMLHACDAVFFSISFMPDHFGRYVGEPLHLTVESFIWWRDRLREIGTVHDARDLLGEGIFYVSK
jgi:hypothetical protein